MNKAIAGLIREGSPEEAMNQLLQRYKNPSQSAYAIYSAWKCVRRILYTDERNRSKDYNTKMEWLAGHVKDPAEATRVMAVTQLPLSKQHSLHSRKLRFLHNKDYDRLFKSIKPLTSAFYAFKLPTELVSEYEKQKRDVVVEQQLHKRKSPEYYTFTDKEIEDIVEWALQRVNDVGISNSTDYYEVALALQLLTGRRNREVAESMTLLPTSHSMQAHVHGIMKKPTDTTVFIIPLLGQYNKVSDALDELRLFKEKHDDYFSQGVIRASKRVFGRNLTHTQKRSIYIEYGYKHRERLGYFPSSTKLYWSSNALCHEFTVSPTQHYQTLIIKSET